MVENVVHSIIRVLVVSGNSYHDIIFSSGFYSVKKNILKYNINEMQYALDLPFQARKALLALDCLPLAVLGCKLNFYVGYRDTVVLNAFQRYSLMVYTHPTGGSNSNTTHFVHAQISIPSHLLSFGTKASAIWQKV
jgi:hypothetical protein